MPDKSFSYRIPIDQDLTDDDKRIIAEAEEILERYKKLRVKYITEKGFDAISFIQDWYKTEVKITQPKTSKP